MNIEQHPERRVIIVIVFVAILILGKCLSVCNCSNNVYEIIGKSENHVYVSRVGSFSAFKSWHYPQADTLKVGKLLIEKKE